MACNELTWNKIQSTSKKKASIAPQVFDTLVLKGLKNNKSISLDVFSFPPLASYPGSKKIGWALLKEEIFAGLDTNWLPAINLPFIKQICYAMSSFIFCSVWLIKNRKENDKQIVMYSSYFAIALPIIFLSNFAKFKFTSVLTDIPLPNINGMSSKLKFLDKLFIKITEYTQSKFDKYVFLTKHMNTLINTQNKPYIIIEGICDPEIFKHHIDKQFNSKKAIMYAGALNKNLGIPLFLEIFSELEDDIEFWIFGSGDYEREVLNASKFNPRIRFYGKVNRETVLNYEKKASLLINLRNPEQEFTKYSFPSKTIEYMSSGTPLLSTKLAGIPCEYYDYIFTVENLTKDVIKSKLLEILSKEDLDLQTFGQRAKIYVEQNKNYLLQGAKIVGLLSQP